MKRTALLPLALLLLIIIMCTVFVGHFEKNSNFKRKQAGISTGSQKSMLRIGENAELNSNIENPVPYSHTPLNIYYSLIQAKKMLILGNIESAESMLKTVLVFYPRNIEALSLLGSIYYMTGRYESAAKNFQEVLAISPGNYPILENLGVVYEKQEKLDKALNEFEKVSLMNPNSTLSLLHIAGINSILGHRQEAMENFIRAYELLGDKILPFVFDPAYDNIRDLPQFVAILHVVNSKKPLLKKKNHESDKNSSR